MLDPIRVMDAVAVSGTNVYKSKVCTPERGEVTYYQVGLTSTATGTLKGQVNNLPPQAYETAVAAAAGATRTAKEAANDVGWVDESFQRSSQKNAAVTAAIPAANPTAAMNGATAAANVTIHVDPGPARHRLVYTNATNSGVLTADRSKG